MAAAAQEEVDVDDDHDNRRSRERRGRREFWDEKRNDTKWATIYMFETINNNSSLKPLLMKVLSSVVRNCNHCW
jgi:hypothetical protein